MYDKMMELLRLLLTKTRAGKVEWEFLPDEEMVRTGVNRGLVRIGRETGGRLDSADGRTLHDPVVYNVWVIGPGGATDAFVVTPLEPRNYEVAADLYREARSAAVDSDKVIQAMIDTLRSR